MDKHLKTASFLANLLDSRFNFLGIRFGIDPLLGLVPGLGDLVSLILSLYLIWIGINLKIPPLEILRMVLNIAVDFLVGLIPVAGDIGDIVFKANIRNLKILQKYA